MRFCPEGPNIPDRLLEDRDNGQVVFFCGAGISMNSGLPSFLELTWNVINRLRVPADSRLRDSRRAEVIAQFLSDV